MHNVPPVENKKPCKSAEDGDGGNRTRAPFPSLERAEQAEHQRDKLAEALRFYAETEDAAEFNEDGGAVARAALLALRVGPK